MKTDLTKYKNKRKDFLHIYIRQREKRKVRYVDAIKYASSRVKYINNLYICAESRIQTEKNLHTWTNLSGKWAVTVKRATIWNCQSKFVEDNNSQWCCFCIPYQ